MTKTDPLMAMIRQLTGGKSASRLVPEITTAAKDHKGKVEDGKDNARHFREQLGKPVGQRPVLNVERQSDWPSFGALTQVAGLSPIVSATFLVSPPRRSPSVTVWPTLSGPSARKIDRT